jgi:beta-galactosidase
MRKLHLFLVVTGAALFSSFSAQAQRLDVEIYGGWRFLQGDPSGAEKFEFDDSTWEPVTLPHNWGWDKAQKGEAYLRGPGWYRRNLNVGPPRPARRYFIRFEAAGSVADVYLNDKLLGQHRGAFGAFSYELTPFLNRSGTNILAVRVSNAVEPDVAPLSGDFCVFGGLYRQVHVIETPELSISPADRGSPGVAWLQTSVNSIEAVLDVTVQVSNSGARRRPATLVARLMDTDNKLVAGDQEEITISPKQTEPFKVQVKVPHPHLWNGRKDPYLYKAVVDLVAASGQPDTVEQQVGLRYYSVDPEKGFLLNGQPYHLHGVNRHQDRPDKGWALTPADQEEDVEMLKEMGATVVRCAHYQHSDYFYKLCDQAGIFAWAEIPQVDEIGTDPRFAETSRSQWLDLIRQNVNHPSIFAWSMFNELRAGKPDPHRLLQDLNAVAHGEDPTRPTIAATCTAELPQMDKIPDLLGWNIYPGWYRDWGPLSDFGPVLDRNRPTSRAGSYAISEYGAGANPAQHEQNPAQPKNDGQWHPEEWQGIYHEAAWAELKKRPFIWGTFVWNMFDFTSYWRNEGGVKGRNDKGLITYDRKIKKDAFYFYKANWSEEPMVYITSRRFTERTNAVTDIKIYSNALQAELMVNGASQGSRTNDGNAVLLWKDIKLKAGENQIEAHAQKSGKVMTDQCVWTLKAP